MAAGWRLLASLLTCLAAPLAGAGEANFALFQRLTGSVLKVEAHNGDGSVSIGSGVVVAPGIVATNCHVTREAQAIELVKGALRRTVEAQHSEIEHDLCLLQAPAGQEEPVAPLAPGEPRVGQPVYAVGFILGVAPRLSAGEIGALHGYDGGSVIETDAAFTSGASGGGLFEADGRLVGLVTFKSRSGAARYFCLPAAWVAQALARFDARPVAPLTGSTFWQRPPAEQPYFLRAATLETARDWPQLAEVARQWSFAEPGNATPWFLLGRANVRLNRGDEAIAAYRAAVGVESGFALAWYRLGRAYLEAGDEAGAQEAHDALIRLDPRLAHAMGRSDDACPEPEPSPC